MKGRIFYDLKSKFFEIYMKNFQNSLFFRENSMQNRNLQIFEHGEHVTGRVIGITQSPSSVILELTNNQRAVLTLTGITDNYLKAHEAIKSYELNQVL